jgi:uncharacterized protein (TIGR03067 family)
MTFANGWVVMAGDKACGPGEGTFTTVVDPKGNRNDLDVTFTEGSNKGKTCYYSYQIEGDKLHIVGHAQHDQIRWMTISSPPGSGVSHHVLQRVTAQNTAKRVKATQAAEEEQEDKSTTAKECMEQLQGTWKVMATTGVWGNLPLKTVTFSGHKLTADIDGYKNCNTFKLVSLTGNPKSIDVTAVASDSLYGGKTAYVIFQIDGDTLYYAIHDDPNARPTDFLCRPGDGRGGFVAKRVSP